MNERTPFRGKRGAERRLVERIETEYAERKAKLDATALDFDVAAVDAEIGDARRAEAAELAKATAARAATKAAAARSARRIPDLSVLPPLLVATGSFASLQERIGSPAVAVPVGGRHAGLTTIPHGAKSFLGAALAATGERLLWIARDSEIGDRLAEELAAWLGDPESVVVLEPRTALAYERSELVPDETAARVAALAAWRSGAARVMVASVQALLQHTLNPADLPAEPRHLKPGDRLVLDRFLLELLGLGYQPVIEVAGRGEFARRGGIVDVFPPGSALPVRIELFGDEVDSLRSFDPTDQRTTERITSINLLPATEFLIPTGGIDELRTGLGRAANRLPERLQADLARFEGARSEGAAAQPKSDGGRALHAGDAAEIWAGIICPATGFDHVPPETLVILDEPGDLAEAAQFLWRQADERRTELAEGGELPKDWPVTYLGPRDWKSRLVRSRTLELTWESEGVLAAGTAMAARGLSSGDLFGWREPVVPAARTGRLPEALDAWRTEGARIVLASDQAPRLAELLAEAGQPTGVTSRLTAAPPSLLRAGFSPPEYRLMRLICSTGRKILSVPAKLSSR